MLVFDTNILLYAANEQSEFHDVCRRRLNEARNDVSPSFVTWSICYEFMRACTHPRFPANPWRLDRAWDFVEGLLDSPSFSILLPTERHQSVLAQTIRETPDIQGNRVHDMHIVALMREHGISRICTKDAGFRRFPFLSVTDP